MQAALLREVLSKWSVQLCLSGSADAMHLHRRA